MAKGALIPGTQGDRVKLNFKGMGQLLRSEEIAKELRQRMARVQAALPGSEMVVLRGGRRVRVKVIRGSDYEEANTGELARALDLSGGKRGLKKKTNKPRPRSS